jgi:hypothetical protein
MRSVVLAALALTTAIGFPSTAAAQFPSSLGGGTVGNAAGGAPTWGTRSSPAWTNPGWANVGLPSDPGLDELNHLDEIAPGWMAPVHNPWSASVGVIWLSRSQSPNPVVATTLPPLSAPVLSAADASLNNQFNPGLIATLGYQFDQARSFELQYFGLHNWAGGASVASPVNDLSLPGVMPLATNDFIFSNRIAIDYSSRFHNVEANFKQSLQGMTLLVGFRHVNLDEQFSIQSTGGLTGLTSDYRVRARNDLLGGQVGLGFDRTFDRFGVGVMSKYGVFANYAAQQSLLRDLGNTIRLRDYEVEAMRTSFLGEIELFGTYRVTNHIMLRAGYRFIGVTNMALAPGHLNFSSIDGDRSVYATRPLLMHGLDLRAEIRW